MRHFEKKAIAERYDRYRPQVHKTIIQALFESIMIGDKLGHVADIACGTGHSTEPLLEFAQQVSGVEASEEMLCLAKARVADASFYSSAAEALPFEDRTLDAIFVCMALHWFDQARFLAEAVRVLKPGAWLCVYNMWFPGEILSNPAYHAWHRKVYQTQFPNPPRHQTPLSHLLEGNREMVFVEDTATEISVRFGPLALRNYLMTQSNIDSAIEKGHAVGDIERWIDDGIGEYFQSAEESFVYKAVGSLARRV